MSIPSMTRGVQLALFVFVVACSTTHSTQLQEPNAASPEIKRQFQKAQTLLKNKKTTDALQIFTSIAKNSPNSDLGLESRMIVGDHFAQKGDFVHALPQYKWVADAKMAGPKNFESRVKVAQTYMSLKDYPSAHDYSEEQLSSGIFKDGEALMFVRIKLEANRARGDYLRAVGNLVYLAKNPLNPQETLRYKDEAIRLVDTRLSFDDLQKVAAGSEFDLVRAQAYYRLGLLSREKGNLSESRDELESAIKYDTTGDIKTLAERAMGQLEVRNQVDPHVIGAILPLSGKFQKVGQKALKGLQLALGIYGKHRSNLELSVIDSEGNPDISRRGVDRLIQEDHAIAIVGGMLAKDAESIAQRAQEYGVPSILLSPKAGITKAGEFVFKNSVTSEMQVRQLVDVAIHKKGLKRFAIMYLNNPYGVEFANIFWDEVLAQGGEVRAAQSYDAKETDFRDAVQRLVGTYYIDDRLPEYRLRLADWQKKQGAHARKNNPKDLLPPVIDFDAVFIPDKPEVVGQVASMLVSNDVTQVTILGPDSWNTRQMVDRIGKLPLQTLFVDTALPEDPTLVQSRFGQECREVFGASPSTIELQSYEAGHLLREALESGESSRIGVRQKLASLDVFTGPTSPLAMSKTREILRPLIPLTVEEQKIKVFSEARTP